MHEILIVGIGNTSRGDDGTGWAVIDLLEKIPFTNVKLSKQKGDIAELLELFSLFHTVYLIDACQMAGSIGSWKRLDAHEQTLPLDKKPTSTHGFTLIEAIELAKNLGHMPSMRISCLR